MDICAEQQAGLIDNTAQLRQQLRIYLPWACWLGLDRLNDGGFLCFHRVALLSILLPLPRADDAALRGTVGSILDKRAMTSDGNAGKETAFRAKNRNPCNPHDTGLCRVARKAGRCPR